MTQQSSPVDVCDICKTPIKDEFVDGRVQGISSWALLCLVCHREHGVGLGTGRGQRYQRQPNGSFTKVEG